MGETLTFMIGDARLTRVAYFDVALPAEAVGLTAEDALAVDGVVPDWCDPDGSVRVGQVFWVIESEGRTIVVDPCCASDPFLRSPEAAAEHQTAAFAALADAGFPRESVDVVVMSHLDGIGMHAWWTGDGWVNAFPNAPLVVSTPEVARIEAEPDVGGRDAFLALRDTGMVTVVDLPHAVTSEVRMVLAGGHTPGMAVVEVASGEERALLTGHLAVNPVHAGVGDRAVLHDDVALGRAALEWWAADAASDGALFVGPLWPAPGAARVTSLDPIRFTPAWP